MGKTPLCQLANQCMQGPQYHLACKKNCRWLLECRAEMDFPRCPARSPLMLAVGSGNADVAELLLEARASVDSPQGPGLDAVLQCANKTQGHGSNLRRILGSLEDRGYQVDWRVADTRLLGGSSANRGRSAGAVLSGRSGGDPWAHFQWGVAPAEGAAQAAAAAPAASGNVAAPPPLAAAPAAAAPEKAPPPPPVAAAAAAVGRF